MSKKQEASELYYELLTMTFRKYRWLTIEKPGSVLMVMCSREERGATYSVRMELPESKLVVQGFTPSQVLLSHAQQMTKALEEHITAKTTPADPVLAEVHDG